MDKISAVLILGICVFVLTSGIIVYETWLSDEKGKAQAETIIEPAGSGNYLIFNDDTSIENNSDSDLWIRVKLVYDNDHDPNEYSIVSNAVEQGRWEYDDEWYYYSKPIGISQTTEPLVDRLLHNGEDVSSQDDGKFSLRVEAVDEAWFMSEPNSGMEAFNFFEDAIAIPDKAYL